MTKRDRTPIRPASVLFHAPTHEPLVCAVLITQDPDNGEYKAYIRPSTEYAPPDPSLLALLVQSVEIRNLPEEGATE